MAEYAESPQVTATAAFENANRTLLTDRQRELAQRIDRKTAESPRSALDSLKDSALLEPIGEGRVQNYMREMFGSEPRGAGTTLGADGATRLTNATNAATRMRLLADEGFEAIRTAPGGAANRNDIRRIVTESVRRWPDARTVFAGMTPAQRDAEIDRILNDPNFSKKVAEVFGDVLDTTKPENQRIVTARNVLATAAKAEGDKQEEFERNQLEVDTKTAEYNSYRVNPVTGATGTKLAERDGINIVVEGANKVAADTALRDAEGRKRVLEDEQRRRAEFDRQNAATRAAAVAAGAGVPRDIATLQGLIAPENAIIAARTNEINEINTKLAKRERLTGEIEQADAKYTREVREAELRRNKTDADRTSLQNSLATAREVVNAYERDIVGKFNEVAGRGSLLYLKERVEDIENKQKAALTELATEATDEEDRNFAEYLRDDRWQTREIRRARLIRLLGVDVRNPLSRNKLRKITVEKGRIRNDFRELMRSGPEGLVREMLTTSNPGLSAAEIDAKMDDRDWVRNRSSEVVATLLSKKYQIGGVNRAEAQRIMESEWGTGQLQEAYNKRNETREQIDALKAQGLITTDTFTPEGIKEAIKKHPHLAMTLLSLALGGAGLYGLASAGGLRGVAAAGAVAAHEIGKGGIALGKALLGPDKAGAVHVAAAKAPVQIAHNAPVPGVPHAGKP